MHVRSRKIKPIGSFVQFLLLKFWQGQRNMGRCASRDKIITNTKAVVQKKKKKAILKTYLFT